MLLQKIDGGHKTQKDIISGQKDTIMISCKYIY